MYLSVVFDIDKLRQYYIVDRLSLSKIATLLNSSVASVSRALKANNIQTRSQSEATKLYWQDPDYKAKMSEISKQRANDPEFYNKTFTDAVRKKAAASLKKRYKDDPALLEELSNKSKQLWSDKKFYEKENLRRNSQPAKDIASSAAKQLWQDVEYKQKRAKISSSDVNRKKHRANTTKLWNDPEYRAKQAAAKSTPEYKSKMAIVMGSMPNCSSLQTMFYSILNDLNVKYYREYPDKPADKECIIGPYAFDCVIPRTGTTTLLIEINGNWTHSQPTRIVQDGKKASYINNNFQSQYELKSIWEHELACKDKIISLIKYWLGIQKQELIEFNFSDLTIKPSLASDYKLLLSKYHYLANAGRGGIAYGAYLNNILIAVCVFSPVVRQNIPDGLISKELSRFCIHPSYQKHNFGTWFISRCLNLLRDTNKSIKQVISYADTTYNHTGALYKAANFKLASKVEPDYWYTSTDGWVMHKKTLYNKASQIHITESEFAAKFGYTKVWGSEKLKFIYNLYDQ